MTARPTGFNLALLDTVVKIIKREFEY